MARPSLRPTPRSVPNNPQGRATGDPFAAPLRDSSGVLPRRGAPLPPPPRGLPATQTMLKLAHQARSRSLGASRRYSQVGVALAAGSGAIYFGCAVEGPPGGRDICAESAAIAAMVLGGDQHIVALCVAGSGGRLPSTCPDCLLAMSSFADDELPILYGADPEVRPLVRRLGDLLVALG